MSFMITNSNYLYTNSGKCCYLSENYLLQQFITSEPKAIRFPEWFLNTNSTRIWWYKGNQVSYEEFLTKTDRQWFWYKEQKVLYEFSPSETEEMVCPRPNPCIVISAVVLLLAGKFAWLYIKN
jgi:hypothetical protein